MKTYKKTATKMSTGKKKTSPKKKGCMKCGTPHCICNK